MSFDRDGFEIKRKFVSNKIIEAIKSEVGNRIKDNTNYGIRKANQKFKTIDALAHSAKFLSLAELMLGSSAKVVRVIYFDKTPDKNWLVSWHQDKTIAVNKRVKVTGWGAWSVKEKTHHVQPSVEVLNSMVTFRVHLDDADKNNGCLKVIPESHQLGILSHIEITKAVTDIKPVLCEAKAGDLLLMKPHILHSSSKSMIPKHRRVVHIEYSNYSLPMDLEWA